MSMQPYQQPPMHPGSTQQPGQPYPGQQYAGQPYPGQPQYAMQPVAMPVVPAQPKNVLVAGILGFFFGPLGMLYASVNAAVIMFAVNVVVMIFTLGLGLLLTLPICAIVAVVAANKHNERLAAAAYGRPMP